MAAISLKVHVVDGRGTPDRVLFQMHGFYSGQLQISTLGPIIDPSAHYLVVSPRGPLKVGDEDAYWYDRGGEGPEGQTFLTALDSLDAALEEVCEERGFRREDTIFLGFSQGASLALALSLRDSDRPRPAGVIAWSGFLPQIDGISYDWDRAAGLPVLVQHGTKDFMMPLAQGEKAALEMQEHGATVSFHTYEMGHDVSVESLGDARAWLDAVYKGTPLSTPLR